ncbi:LacI family DNA-binding transcriptional regulator [Brevibacterium salitolerans]|uniref:LacI family DNA-binding transcriptional regulator n=1 Tax=Brevibacterium salitolerans TaxID=1403566 RepID=A0ABN2WE80_9MICO
MEPSATEVGPEAGRRGTAAAIARKLGISQAAVSYVLNGRPGVSAATRRKVLELANEAGVRPSRAGARGLSRVIALIVPSVANPMFTSWAQEVISNADRAGFEVLLATTDDAPEKMVSVARMLVNRGIDGVITAAAHREDSRALGILREGRIPFTFLSRRSSFVTADFVGIDDFAAAQEITRHVLRHGHTRIATVVGPRFSSSSHLRERGFAEALSAHGLTVPRHRRVSTELSRDGGRRAGLHLLAHGGAPEAVLCGSDELAAGVMEVLDEADLVPGRDVAVTGFDGLEQSTSRLVGMSCVVQPARTMAQQATAQLLGRIEDRSRREAQALVLPHRLHIGRTCGCEPAAAAEERPAAVAEADL